MLDHRGRRPPARGDRARHTAARPVRAADGVGRPVQVFPRCHAAGARFRPVRSERLHSGLRRVSAPGAAMKVPFLELRAAAEELRAELDAAYRRVLDSGWYILGREVEAFESEFAQYCGARHCVGVGNGLDALHLILRGWDIGPGDEVIVPANTYIASWLAVSFTGATPVPVEPESASFNIDPARVEAAITPRTKAIMAVHLYGLPAEMAPLMGIAEKHGLKVV